MLKSFFICTGCKTIYVVDLDISGDVKCPKCGVDGVPYEQPGKTIVNQ